MASGIQVTLNTKRRFELGNVTGKDALRRLANLINGALNGSGPEISDWLIAVRPENVDPSNNHGPAIFSRAVQFWTIASGSGPLTISTSLMGEAEWEATGTNASDAAGLTNLWNLGGIQAATVGKMTNIVGLIELNNVQPGQTLKIGGYVFTAVAGTGFSPIPFTFTVGNSNNDDAVYLAKAINLAPGLLSSVRAQAAAAAIYLCIYDDSAPSKFFISTPNPSTIAINSQFANTGRLAIVLNQPGFMGCALGWSSSGTGLTALGGGSSGNFQNGSGIVLNTDAAEEYGYSDRITSQTSKNRL